MSGGTAVALEPGMEISIGPDFAPEIVGTAMGLDVPPEQRGSMLDPDQREPGKILSILQQDPQKAISVLSAAAALDPVGALRVIDSGLTAISQEQLDLANRINALMNPETVGASLGLLISQLAADGYLSAADMAMINSLELARPAVPGSNPELERYVEFQVRTFALEKARRSMEEREKELEAQHELLLQLRILIIDSFSDPIQEPVTSSSSDVRVARSNVEDNVRRVPIEEIERKKRLEEPTIYRPVDDRPRGISGPIKDEVGREDRLASALAALERVEALNPEKYGPICDRVRNELRGYVEGGFMDLNYVGSIVGQIMADADTTRSNTQSEARTIPMRARRNEANVA